METSLAFFRLANDDLRDLVDVASGKVSVHVLPLVEFLEVVNLAVHLHHLKPIFPRYWCGVILHMARARWLLRTSWYISLLKGKAFHLYHLQSFPMLVNKFLLMVLELGEVFFSRALLMLALGSLPDVPKCKSALPYIFLCPAHNFVFSLLLNEFVTIKLSVDVTPALQHCSFAPVGFH